MLVPVFAVFVIFAFVLINIGKVKDVSSSPSSAAFETLTDKKEKKIYLIYMEIQSGAVAKSYTRKGFLMYEEMRKYFSIYEEAVSYI